MKPELPPTLNQYKIRRPKFRVPFIKHVFAEQLLEYQMIIKLMNLDPFIIRLKCSPTLFLVLNFT